MKINTKFLFAAFIILLTGAELQAQYGYGNGYGGGGYGYGYGRQRNAIPQAHSEPKAPEPKTADQIVDDEMPGITEALELNEFEAAVMSSILKKSIQKRIELQILELAPDKMREALEKITEQQTEELKSGLSEEKYEAFVELQKKGLAKAQKEKKKEGKKKKKKKKKPKD
ncbi:hypothetical protein JQC67_14705 [Aurantibacter crassamenti]|uniref:hypothetical protein n=1 Tax=Aurantibacter crassamenti TaxID=1837375 RepID=UPI001939F7EA|nr:hypothetical protein [Aurantibacter crassamenti]MBM1107402.1 hypothetical protein [Aurantibacter crassamenti]